MSDNKPSRLPVTINVLYLVSLVSSVCACALAGGGCPGQAGTGQVRQQQQQQLSCNSQVRYKMMFSPL